jgi:2-polyprenyl-6-methoxyphenol hydroxylase-like FAD-dependent oxidoreductase
MQNALFLLLWNFYLNMLFYFLCLALFRPILTLRRLSYDVVVVGGGPCGLTASIMLAQKGFRNIACFDQRPAPRSPSQDYTWGQFANDKSFILGLSGRGQAVLKELDVLSRVDQYTQPVMARGDIAPAGKHSEDRQIIQNILY